jgi:uncharacterized protein YceK
MNLQEARPKLYFLLLVIPLLLVGCGSLPSKDASRLSAAAKVFDSIKVDTTEAEAFKTLGPPTITDGNELEWFTRFNRNNYESLKVLIDEKGKIEKTVRRHKYFSGGAFEYSNTKTFSRSFYD